MAYTLKKSDGSILVVLPDQQSDTESTSLTLIGKNVNAYGTDINQNYIRHLENFAYSVSPSNPLVGQVWYDTVEQRIKVYTVNNEFKPVGSPTISPTRPKTLSIGDLWYDSTAKQLKFLDNSDNIIAIGPTYDITVGKSGWVTEGFLTNTNSTQTVSSLYSNDVLLGILSEVSSITLSSTLTTITSLNPGITLQWNSSVKAKFIGTATSADSLTKSDGTKIYADGLLNTGSTITTYQPINILNDDPTGSLIVGTNEDFQFYPTTTSTNTATLYLGGLGKPYDISMNPADLSGKTSVLHFSSAEITGVPRLGIFNTDPTEHVDIIGNVKIQGDLTVYGTSTYIESQDLRVIDSTIELAVVDTPTNDTADGGGIIIRSGGVSTNPLYANIPTTNKEIRWVQRSPNFSAFNVWSITDNVELRDSTSTYYIGGQPVLSLTSLGPQVTASNLTSIGDLIELNAGGIRLSASGTNAIIGVATPNNSIVIGDAGTLDVQFFGKALLDAETPTGLSPDSQVATKGYVDERINDTRNLKAVMSIDVTGHANSSIDIAIDDFVIRYLGYVLPVGDGAYDSPAGTLARIICVRYTTPGLPAVPSNTFDFIPVTVDKNNVPESASVVEYAVNTYRVTTDFPAVPFDVNRVVKQYIANNVGTWEAYPSGPVGNIIHTEGTW
jgi:hypothetical protein